MVFSNTKQIEDFLFSRASRKHGQNFRGGKGLGNVKKVLKALGEPQNKLKVIHIAGTSGKGSTANFISHILHDAGFKTGLHISPHLLDIRERFQVNNQLISEQKYLKYFNDLFNMFASKKISHEDLSYFEILTIFAFFVFHSEKVDYAIIETGLGGLYDATNAISSKNKIAVLTKIGFDHVNVLGKTLGEITYQKAMIINLGNVAVSAWQSKSARETIEKVAGSYGAKLSYIKIDKNFCNIRQIAEKTYFDFKFEDLVIKDIELKMPGIHQAENCSLALAAISILSKRDKFDLKIDNIKKLLSTVIFPGRMEIKKMGSKLVILDGAHNAQKMAAFTKTLGEIFPETKFLFLIAFKKGKDVSGMVQKVIPLASEIVITSFFRARQDMPNLSADPEKIARALDKNNFKNYKIIINHDEALTYLKNRKNKHIVITGSLYLISEVYNLIK